MGILSFPQFPAQQEKSEEAMNSKKNGDILTIHNKCVKSLLRKKKIYKKQFQVLVSVSLHGAVWSTEPDLRITVVLYQAPDQLQVWLN